MAWNTAERSTGHVQCCSTVAAHNRRNMGRPRNALVLEQLDAERVQLDLDLSAMIPDDLPRQREWPAVPLLQRLPQPLRDQLEVLAPLELDASPQLAALARQGQDFRRRGENQARVFDQARTGRDFSCWTW